MAYIFLAGATGGVLAEILADVVLDDLSLNAISRTKVVLVLWP